MSIDNNNNPAGKSKEKICGALMTLLKTTRYDKISISMLCNEANVSRPTFYKYFKNMDAVAYYRLSEIRNEFDKDNPYSRDIKLRFAKVYSYFKSNDEMVLILEKNKLFNILEARIKDSYKYYMEGHEEQIRSDFLKEYLPDYMAATVVSLMRKWIENGYKETPEQMAEVTVELMEGYSTLLIDSLIEPEQVYVEDPVAEDIDKSIQPISDILNNIPNGVCVLFMPDELHQEIRFANKQMMRMISPNTFEPENTSPQASSFRAGYYKNAFSGVYPEDLRIVLETFREGFGKSQFRVPPVRLLTDSGKYEWFSVDVALREVLPEGRVFYASYRNVSKEVQLRLELNDQEELMQQALDSAERANAAKSAFLSSMSHDIRTPLNGILGFTRVALKENDPVLKQEYLEKILASGDLLLSLVNDTLDLSRIESGKMQLELEEIDGMDFISSVLMSVKSIADQKKIKLSIETDKLPHETIYTDRLKLQKIILNLLTNAVKYTDNGGSVRFAVEAIDSPGNTMTRRIIVQDNGIGMSKEFLEQMYEPFTQERRQHSAIIQGTGLGLSIVRRIVDLMGGTIQVESEINEGTKFTVDLPIICKAAKIMETKKQRVVHKKLKGKRVLVAEDNYMNAEITTIFLKEKGIITTLVENGKLCVEKFEESEPGTYNAILMDIHMPVMNGYEATRFIRNLDHPDAAKIPIIAMTADAFEEDVSAALDAGMDAHIAKPIEPLKAVEILEKFIGD